MFYISLSIANEMSPYEEKIERVLSCCEAFFHHFDTGIAVIGGRIKSKLVIHFTVEK